MSGSRLLAAALGVLMLTGCATADAGTPGAGQVYGADVSEARVRVVTGFYPLQYAAQRVVGEVPGVSVQTLASPGVDAHDLELSPRQVGAVQDASLVIYAAQMQAALDAAVAEQAPHRGLDIAAVVTTTASQHTDEHAHTDEHGHADGHGHDHSDGHDHAHGGADPHFWLDPTRYAAAADAIAARLAQLDPAHAADYRANAAALEADLHALDEEFTQGLAHCAQHTLVTTHEAFGQLADRYGLQQQGITGISPDAVASPAQMARITRTVESLGLPAIYAQSSLGTDLAEVIAAETGTEVLVLDPLESITDGSPGEDYFEVMRANLTALQQGLGCSR